uniref:Uncharacterized protein n=1 Tax=Glossina palpalis gambiensis TaxID=67801 RepID=A0A1B0AMM9_9MUSC
MRSQMPLKVILTAKSFRTVITTMRLPCMIALYMLFQIIFIPILFGTKLTAVWLRPYVVAYCMTIPMVDREIEISQKLTFLLPRWCVRQYNASAAITAHSAEIDTAVARDCDKLLRYLTSGRHEIDVVGMAVGHNYEVRLHRIHNSYYAQRLSESFASFLIYLQLLNTVSFKMISVAFIRIKARESVRGCRDSRKRHRSVKVENFQKNNNNDSVNEEENLKLLQNFCERLSHHDDEKNAIIT